MSDRVKLSAPGARRFLGAVLGIAVIVVGATGCEEQIDVRGNLPHAKTITSIKPGVHKRQDIEAMLGTPSAVATFDKEIWYYIGGRVKTVSFFTPEVLERKVLTVRFDENGVVESIRSSDAPTETVQVVDRETPTKGKDITILQQLLGNIGRFSDPRGNQDSNAPY